MNFQTRFKLSGKINLAQVEPFLEDQCDCLAESPVTENRVLDITYERQKSRKKRLDIALEQFSGFYDLAILDYPRLSPSWRKTSSPPLSICRPRSSLPRGMLSQ